MTPAARERAQVRTPLLIVSASAWIVLVATSGGAAHPHHATAPLSSLAGFAMDWFVMLAAMMAPLLAGPVRHIRDRSLAQQRVRSIALFVSGYAAVWMAAGAVLQAIAGRARAVDSPMPILLVACAAAVWQCSPIKQQCLNHGHVHPELAGGGRAADIAARRFGFVHGAWCVGSCWALMLLPMMIGPATAGHYSVLGPATAGPIIHLAAMALVSLWIAAERLERPMARAWRVRAPERAARLVYARLALRNAS